MVITALKEDQSGGQPDLADLQAWANSLGLSHPVVLGQSIAWGLAGGFPTFFLLDQNMQCRYKQGGYDQQAILTWINQLLANPPTPIGGDTPTPTPRPTDTPEPPTNTPEPATNTPTPIITDTPTLTPTGEPSSPTPTLTATPYVSPTPTEPAATVTPTPEQFEGVRLHISDDYFTTGTLFELTASIESASHTQADFYCVLDVVGSYYFYPNWGMELTSEAATVPMEKTLLQFTWPAVDGSFSGIKFWSLATEPGTYNYFGEIAMVEFGYGQ